MGSEIGAQGDVETNNRQAPVLKPGYNCRQVATAHRTAVLIDGAAYFAVLEKALRSATRSIFIVGWDFDARIRLRPQDGSDAPALGDILRRLVEERPDLEIRILIWSLAPVHAPGAATALVFGAEWQDHPRIHLRLDTHHPMHAAHHQKIVTIDGSLAFVGGIDLTVDRWDRAGHAADEPLRSRPDGSRYEPVHDIQVVVSGPAARLPARVAHERWRDFTGEEVPLDKPADRWPRSLSPDFTNVPVGISRTLPALDARPAVEESAALMEDLLRAAGRTIYIEAQYFTAKRLRGILREVLSRPDAPEIVVVGPLNANGIIERFIMGANRERLLRSLGKTRHYDRLRVYYPVTTGAGHVRPVLIHAKLVIVDDRLLRIGSSNLNNRSVGLDTECDLVIEADRPETRQVIADYRDRLLAEHLGVNPAEIADAIHRQGSLIGAINALNGDKCLRPLAVGKGTTHSFPGTRFLDPERPFRLMERFRAWWYARPAQDGSAERRSLEPESRSSDKTNNMLPSRSGRRK